jgi:class 3 adenylate cyclase
MSPISTNDVADGAGVEPGYVDTLVELGILAPAPDGGFSPGATRAVRVIRDLERSGLTLDSIAGAVEADELDFRMFDMANYDRFAPLTSETFREASTRTGVPLELLLQVRQAIGFAVAAPDDRMRTDEAAIVPMLLSGVEGGFPVEAQARVLRVYGESLHRMVEAATEAWTAHVVGPLIASGMSVQEAFEQASAFGEANIASLDQAILAMHHGHQARVWTAGLYDWAEGALERAGLWSRVARPPAMCFIDLSGYTRLTEERGDRAAAELALTFSRLVQGSAHERRGTVVKWLGDGVMLFFERPSDAIANALEMVERLPEAGLPPAHVGIDAGPVIVQDGDYFGRTVNVAARISARAGADQILASGRTIEAAGRLPEDVSVHDLGSAALKGISTPVPLFRVERGR